MTCSSAILLIRQKIQILQSEFSLTPLSVCILSLLAYFSRLRFCIYYRYLLCVGYGEKEQPPEDGSLPPAPARAPGDGPLPTRLHDEDVSRVQGEGADEEGSYIYRAL